MRSNTFIVLTALIALFGIFMFVIHVFSDNVIHPQDRDFMINKDLFIVEDIMTNLDHDDWPALAEEIGPYNWQIQVSAGDEVVYSNAIRPLDGDTDRYENTFERIMSIQMTNPQMVYNKDQLSVIRAIKTYKNTEYDIIALNFRDDINLTDLSMQDIQNLISNVFIIGIMAISAILLLSRLFTRLMVKRIMKPINLLMDGVKRIENNDFSEPVIYEGEMEFTKLCDAFNDMQDNLLEEMKLNTEMDEMRTDMISGISHDLRTPLTSIKGFLKGMKDGVANTEEKKKQYIDICYKKACDMDDLLKHLFYYSKLETKRMPFHFEEVDLTNILENLVETQESHLEAGVTLSYDKPERAMICPIDTDQFYRVYTNLIENSVKYAQMRPLNIKITLSEEDAMYRIVFSDNGKGISEEKLAKVFDQFYRGDESRNSSVEGSGLGLYVSKHIIECHGGSIEAENNHGFSVTILLPKDREGIEC